MSIQVPYFARPQEFMQWQMQIFDPKDQELCQQIHLCFLNLFGQDLSPPYTLEKVHLGCQLIKHLNPILYAPFFSLFHPAKPYLPFYTPLSPPPLQRAMSTQLPFPTLEQSLEDLVVCYRDPQIHNLSGFYALWEHALTHRLASRIIALAYTSLFSHFIEQMWNQTMVRQVIAYFDPNLMGFLVKSVPPEVAWRVFLEPNHPHSYLQNFPKRPEWFVLFASVWKDMSDHHKTLYCNNPCVIYRLIHYAHRIEGPQGIEWLVEHIQELFSQTKHLNIWKDFFEQTPLLIQSNQLSCLLNSFSPSLLPQIIHPLIQYGIRKKLWRTPLIQTPLSSPYAHHARYIHCLQLSLDTSPLTTHRQQVLSLLERLNADDQEWKQLMEYWNHHDIYSPIFALWMQEFWNPSCAWKIPHALFLRHCHRNLIQHILDQTRTPLASTLHAQQLSYHLQNMHQTGDEIARLDFNTLIILAHTWPQHTIALTPYLTPDQRRIVIYSLPHFVFIPYFVEILRQKECDPILDSLSLAELFSMLPALIYGTQHHPLETLLIWEKETLSIPQSEPVMPPTPHILNTQNLELFCHYLCTRPDLANAQAHLQNFLACHEQYIRLLSK